MAGHYHADHIGAIDELINGGIPVNLASYDRGGAYTVTISSTGQTFNYATDGAGGTAPSSARRRRRASRAKNSATP